LQRKVSCSPFVIALRSTATGASLSCVPRTTTFRLLTGRHFWIAIYQWLSDFLKNTIFNYLGNTARHIAVVNALWLTAVRLLLHWILSTIINRFDSDINMWLAMKATTTISNTNCLCCCTHPNVLWGAGTAAEYFSGIDLMMDDDDYFSTNKSIQLTNCGGMSIVGLFARVFLVNLLSVEPERSWNQSLNSGMQNYLFSQWLATFVLEVIHSIWNDNNCWMI